MPLIDDPQSGRRTSKRNKGGFNFRPFPEMTFRTKSKKPSEHEVPCQSIRETQAFAVRTRGEQYAGFVTFWWSTFETMLFPAEQSDPADRANLQIVGG